MKTKLCSLIVLLTGCVLAQSSSLVGLPDAGVLLTGTPDNPILQNNTGRVILAWTVFSTDSKGIGFVSSKNLMLMLRDGPLKPQASIVHLSPAGQHGAYSRPLVMGPSASAVLDAVVFGDGEVAGPDRTGMQLSTSGAIQGEQGVDKLFLAGDLLRLGEIAKGQNLLAPEVGSGPIFLQAFNGSQQGFAQELLRVRDKMGEQFARSIAAKSAAYPTLWRK